MSLISSVIGFGAFGFGARCFQLGLQKRNMFDGAYNVQHLDQGLMNSTTWTRSSNSSIRIIRLRSIRNGKEAVRLCSPDLGAIWRRVETDIQGIPTSRQEEEVNGNPRKGECRVSGKEGDYIGEGLDGGVDWMYIIGRTCSITTGLRIGEPLSPCTDYVGFGEPSFGGARPDWRDLERKIQGSIQLRVPGIVRRCNPRLCVSLNIFPQV